jgi:hypothetical protein
MASRLVAVMLLIAVEKEPRHRLAAVVLISPPAAAAQDIYIQQATALSFGFCLKLRELVPVMLAAIMSCRRGQHVHGYGDPADYGYCLACGRARKCALMF